MKFKKIVVPKFEHSDEFGKIMISNVEVLFDPTVNDIKAETFDQNKNEYHLSSKEIQKMSILSARRFYDENIALVLNGSKVLNSREIGGIKEFLKVSGAELGDLIGMDKSSISRLLSKKQDPQKDKMMLLMERLREELDHPGISKIYLEKLRSNDTRLKNIEQLCLPATQIAEFFIRRFHKTEGPITHLKLQKLLYYAQGIGFGRADLKLIKEPFLAWEHGPVIKEVYDVYKTMDKNPLPVNEHISLDLIKDNELVLSILEETISLYGVYDAWFLREKTHSEKPWMETKRDDVMSDSLMHSFFKKILV